MASGRSRSPEDRGHRRPSGGLEKRFDEFVEQQKRVGSCWKRGERTRRDRERRAKREARKLNNLGVTSFHNGATRWPATSSSSGEARSEFSEAYNKPGLAHTEIGEEEKATEAFQKAAELDRRSTRPTTISLHHVQTGNYEQPSRCTTRRSAGAEQRPAYTKPGGTRTTTRPIEDARAPRGRRPWRSIRATKRRNGISSGRGQDEIAAGGFPPERATASSSLCE